MKNNIFFNKNLNIILNFLLIFSFIANKNTSQDLRYYFAFNFGFIVDNICIIVIYT